MADRIVVTKTDLATSTERALLRERIRRIQPAAPHVESRHGRLEPGELFGERPAHMAVDALEPIAVDEHGRASAHGDGVRTFSVVLDHPVVFERLALWLATMTQIHGDHLRRVKGIVRIVGESAPLVVQAVQHVV